VKQRVISRTTSIDRDVVLRLILPRAEDPLDEVRQLAHHIAHVCIEFLAGDWRATAGGPVGNGAARRGTSVPQDRALVGSAA